jgi:hypothetical protein
MRGILAAGFCCLVAACGSMDIERYAVAEGKPSARLHIDYRDQTGTPTQVFVMKNAPGPQCRLGISDLSLLTALGGSTNALTDYKPEWSRDVQVAAGEPITLSLGTSAFVPAGRVSCGFRARFVPQAGAEYVMTFESAAQKCYLGLARRSADGSLATVPWTDPYPQCNPKKDPIMKPLEDLQPKPSFPTR